MTTTERREAEERLLDAALAQVLLEEPAVRAGGRGGNWLVAALVLLGVFVAGGVAWLRSNEAASAVQEPGAFDPVFPWYEAGLPFARRFTLVNDLATLASLPPTATALRVGVVNPDLLAAVVAHPGVRALVLVGSGDPRPDRAIWRGIGSMQGLESLALSVPGVTAADLRELRTAPRLTTLGLEPSGPLEAELVACLAELPHLDALLLFRPKFDERTTGAIAKLRGLRFLWIEAPKADISMSAEQLQHLATLPRLQVLGLSHRHLADDDLGRLPAQLQSLSLPQLHGVTAPGLLSLARLSHLRALSFRGITDDALDAAKVELVGKLPLEQFESRVEVPTPELWAALQVAPRLRGLAVRCVGGVAPVIAEAAKVRGLERLTLLGKDLPTPEQLAPLRQLKHLRRVDLEMDISSEVVKPTPEQVASLRTCLGPKVEVVVR